MSKKCLLFFMLLSVFLLKNSSPAQAESITLTTYYPAPFGAYDQVRLVPRTLLGGPCLPGTIYTDTAGGLHYCLPTSVWGNIPGVFSQVGNDVFLTDNDINPNLNVGIGTKTPQAKLDVTGTVRSPLGLHNQIQLVLSAIILGNPCQPGTIYGDTAGGLHYCLPSNTWGYIPTVLSQTGNNVYLTDNDTNPNLKVGIGTTTPAGKLTVKGIGTTTGIGFETQDSAGNPLLTIQDNGISHIAKHLDIGQARADPAEIAGEGGGIGFEVLTGNSSVEVDSANNSGWGFESRLELQTARGTPGAPADSADGDSIGRISFEAYYNQGFPTFDGNDVGIAYIEADVDGPLTAASSPGRLIFMTNPPGSFEIPVERMRITSAGNVGIGVTAPTEMLHVGGNINANATVYPSDQRFKEEIVPLKDALSRLEQIRGVSFKWNKLSEGTGHKEGTPDIGVIAQEVEKVLPEIVSSSGKDGYKAVDYGRLVPVLIEAVKELKTENDLLKTRVEKLESQLPIPAQK